MDPIKRIKLEILRPGPSHNQLLSPLTPYLAICRQDGPVTIHLPYEQRQMLTRLERLRYYAGKDRIADNQREAELRELGESLGRILGEIPALISELGGVRPEQGTLVHLRLAFSAKELALVPFECAIAPDGFPGSGSPLFLQANIPIALTREIRHGRDPEVKWNRKPRILFIYATPGALAPVPFARHLLALRQAIDPWIAGQDTPEEQVREVAKMLTVLPEASLPQIRQACADNVYTHVHILGHGASYEYAGDQRYGLALCGESDPTKTDVVDGERLALALTTGRATTCSSPHRPTVVTLATCDSANEASVLTPGGSIAHELHAAGIPWVFASQFPLWMRSSTLFTAILYKRLLQGADPRCVLHELRQRLRTTCPETHDWASIVAYASVPWDFAAQIEAFYDRQNRARIETQLSRIDRLLGSDKDKQRPSKDCETEITSLCEAIRHTIDRWFDGRTAGASGVEMAERLGISGASEKRIGIAYARLAEKAIPAEQKTQIEANRRRAYERACAYYRRAMDEAPGNHWLVTQYLSMRVISDPLKQTSINMEDDGAHWWRVAREICNRQATVKSGDERSWAYSSLAELELLGTVFGGADYQGPENLSRTAERIAEYCGQLVQLCGADAFGVQSTIRQFRRYLLDSWKMRPEWEALAAAALHALGDAPEPDQPGTSDSST